MSPLLERVSKSAFGFLGSTGPAGAFESIASAAGTGSSGTITFSNIPSTYQHLQIRCIANNNEAIGGQISLRFNSDTGSNYSWHSLRGNGTSASAQGATTQSLIDYVGRANTNANIYGASIIDIHDYASTSKYKTTRTFYGYDNNGSGWVFLTSGLWMSTSAVTSITLFNVDSYTFSTASTFALYGIKGA